MSADGPELKLKEAGEMCQLLALRVVDRASLKLIPGLVKKVIRENLWQERKHPITGAIYKFDKFEAFVETHATLGMGLSMAELLDLCRHDADALAAIDRAIKQKPGESQNVDFNTCSLLEAALRYAALGLAVLPLRPGHGRDGSNEKERGKAPHKMLGGTGGIHHATTDEDQIRAWWSEDPEANIGLPMLANNLVGIDVDNYGGKTDIETLKRLQGVRVLGGLPYSWQQASGSGLDSHHQIFKNPGVPIAGQLEELVLRSKHYLVVAPSVHKSGRKYAWRDKHGPNDRDPADLPAAWVEAVAKKEVSLEDFKIPEESEEAESLRAVSQSERVELMLRSIRKEDGEKKGGTGVKMFTLAVTATLGFAVRDPRAVIAALVEHNAKCDPPYPVHEIERKVWNAYNDGQRVWGSAPTLEAHIYAKRREVIAELPVDAVWTDDDVKAALLRTEKNAPKICGSNVNLILRHSQELAGKLRFNEITRSLEVTSGQFAKMKSLDTLVRNWLETEWKLFVSKSEVGDQLFAVAQKFGSYDPVREYLDGLAWDGVPRLDTWLAEFCNVAPSEYASAVGAKWLISGAARGLRPGIKADSVLILQGKQGIKKSTILRTLAEGAGPGAFSDSPLDLGNKDARISASATWIVEFPELAALGQRDLETCKAFLSAQSDKVRPPYGRADEIFYRHCICGGTTNAEEFLIDDTGNRRFWVVRVEDHVDIERLRAVRDQLWGEAVVRFRAGERYWFDAAEQLKADVVTDTRKAEDVWAGMILEWWEAQGKANKQRPFKLADVAIEALDLLKKDLPRHTKQVARSLRSAGFEPDRDPTKRFWAPALAPAKA